MQSTLRIGVVQMRSTEDPWENLLLVESFIEEARNSACELIVFPEAVFYRGPRKALARRESQLALDAAGFVDRDYSDFSKAVAESSEHWPIDVILGSVLESRQGSVKPFNSQWVFGQNSSVSSYAKIHLFEFQGERAHYSESTDCEAGHSPMVTLCHGWRTMSSICYDLRFPELYRRVGAQAPTDLILIPAAFTKETGQVHWHALLRARAIENLSFVAAPAQWGRHRSDSGNQLECFGHAVIYDPWGGRVAEASGSKDCLLVADLSRDRLTQARARLPDALRPRLLEME